MMDASVLLVVLMVVVVVEGECRERLLQSISSSNRIEQSETSVLSLLCCSLAKATDSSSRSGSRTRDEDKDHQTASGSC